MVPFLFWGGFEVNLKSIEKRKRERVLKTSNSTETKPLSDNKSGNGDEQTEPEQITSAQPVEKEPEWENNEFSVLGSVDKTQIVEEITSAQLPEEEIDCIKNDSPVLGSEIQIVKKGLIHTKKVSK